MLIKILEALLKYLRPVNYSGHSLVGIYSKVINCEQLITCYILSLNKKHSVQSITIVITPCRITCSYYYYHQNLNILNLVWH